MLVRVMAAECICGQQDGFTGKSAGNMRVRINITRHNSTVGQPVSDTLTGTNTTYTTLINLHLHYRYCNMFYKDTYSCNKGVNNKELCITMIIQDCGVLLLIKNNESLK